MSNTQIPIHLQTNIQKLHAQGLDSIGGFGRYRSLVTDKPRVFGNGDPSLTVDEEKALHRTLLRKYVSDDATTFARSNCDILVKKDSHVTKLDDQHGSFLLTIYEGDVPPPTGLKKLDYSSVFKESKSDDAMDDDDTDVVFHELTSFKRSRLPTGHSSPFRQRWFRIHAVGTTADLTQAAAHDIFSTEGIRFCRIPVKLACSEPTLRQALTWIRGTGGNDSTSSMTLQQFLEVGGRFEPEQSDEVRNASNELGFPGLRVLIEPKFSVRLSHNSDQLVTKRWQTNVYLQNGPETLSDFVVDHCPAPLNYLKSSEGIEMLTAKLRGVHIQTGPSHESRTVKGFRNGTTSDRLFRQQRPVRPPGRLSKILPFVDVGTLEKPFLLPMEACQIDKLQSLRGPRGPGLDRYINSLANEESAKKLSESCAKVEATLVFQQPLQTADMKDRLNKACEGKLPNLLFVEAGSTPIAYSRWSDLRNALKDCLHEPFGTSSNASDSSMLSSLSDKNGASMPLLSLRYDSKSDPSTKWARELRNFVKEWENVEQKTIVIVWLESEQDCNTMYNIIKGACDMYVGVQTFFIRCATYERQIQKAPEDVDHAARCAANIRRRICQKNYTLDQQRTTGDKVNLVIAMHVSPVYVASQRDRLGRGQDGKSDTYLLTLVSRDPTLSKDYCTEQGLFSGDQIMSHEHMKLVSTFTSKKSFLLGNVTILRSGVVSLPQANIHTPEDTLDLTDSANFIKSGTESTNMGPKSSHQKKPAQRPTPESELQAILDELPAHQNNAQPRLLTYVTLTEAELSTFMDPIDYEKRPSDNCSATLFTVDALLVKPEDRSIMVQQVPRVLPANLKKAGQVRPGAIMATFSDTRQIDATTPQQRRAEPYRMKGDTRLDPQRDTTIVEADINFLAAIWKDDGLGLYSTKWPVPTHLAHLAAKRAMIHLRKDDMQSSTDLFSLPKIHERVRNTLYYL